MNGKQAKKIRRAAEKQTVGEYVRNYVLSKTNSRQVLLAKSCTRKRIKDLKREFHARTRVSGAVRNIRMGQA